MIIRQTRIRSLTRHLRPLQDGERYALGVRITAEREELLASIGFSPEWEDGETILPSSEHGPACRRNAEGEIVKHRDQPMETAYREFEWSWTEWHGPDSVEQSQIVYQPYERYPQTFIPPTGLELTTIETPQGRMVVHTTHFVNGADETTAVDRNQRASRAIS